MTSRIEKAFEFAQETTKQLITLATGVIALTITFLSDVVKDAPPGSQTMIQIAWIAYLISIVSGIFGLMALTGNLETAEDDSLTIYAKNIVIFSAIQVCAFCAAVALTLAFGFVVV